MLKSLGVVIGGIFVGAVGVEIIRKKCPETLDKMYAKVRSVAAGANDAFKKGYEKAVQPSEDAAEPSV